MALVVVLSLTTAAEHAYAIATNEIAQFSQNAAYRRLAYDWISHKLPVDAEFAVYEDGGLYLYTGRQGIRNEVMTRPSITGNPEELGRPITKIADFARAHGLRYLIWSPDDYAIDGLLGNRGFRERLFAKNSGLVLLYEAHGVRIYEVN